MAKEEKKIVYKGLSNEGATCYMNKLLQNLYMTPEFRKIIYEWQYDEVKHGAKELSIPYQIQKLFANLQCGKRLYADTQGLTKSFKWDIGQLMEQQDIQEFSRLLIDAIEMSDSEKKLNISQIYEGFSSEYVKCTECGYESSNKAKFLDIQLPISDPFTKTSNSSVESALENYLKPEVLTGDNKYECQKCKKKVEAKKGCKFGKMPPILALQLNRFTLNMATFSRVKVMDRVTFPFVLNMNNYMNGYENIKKHAGDCEKSLEEVLKPFKEELVESSPKKISIEEKKEKPKVEQAKEEKIILTTKEKEEKLLEIHSKQILEYQKEGGDVYELFSVIIHTGGAFGGHYYDYIKSFQDGKWYLFNDKVVQEISLVKVLQSFGDPISGKCAYLLMYKRVGQEPINVMDENIPKYLKEDIEQQAVQQKIEETVFKDLARRIDISVYYNKESYIVPVTKDSPLFILKQLVFFILLTF